MEDRIKYMVEAIKEELSEGKGDWSVMFKDGSDYTFKGTLKDVIELCQKLGDVPTRVNGCMLTDWEVVLILLYAIFNIDLRFNWDRYDTL